MNDERPVFKGSHLAQSMRSSGYKNTAYALAEIIDNSVEAKAANIEIMCAQKQNYSADPPIKQLEQIAIADDGVGMNKEELWNSLIMGEGTRYETRGIGKFGMGLPNSSMSQCKHVTVYSWQNPDSVFFVEMDLDKTVDGLSIKSPQKTEIPTIWKSHSKHLKNAQSGTLVVWDKIDKFQWKRTKTLVRNLERIVGRVYRKFIHGDKINIRCITFDANTATSESTYDIRPNDPLYQMIPSSTPEPWNDKSMFEVDGDCLEDEIEVDGHKVILRCTIAKKEAREEKGGIRAGSLPHGKHANSNLGISVIRANRELYLDTNLCQTYDPLERWWGVEVDFPTELDDVFGVTHNKQDANNFSAMTHEIGALSRDEMNGKSQSDDDEGSTDLRDFVITIHARIAAMRTLIKKQNKSAQPKPGSTTQDPWPEDPYPGPTVTGGQGESMNDKEKEEAITEALSKIYDHEEASAAAKNILKYKIKTKLEVAALGFSDFFDVSLKGGVTIITLNSDHPAYKRIIEVIQTPDNFDLKNKEILQSLQAAINMLFVSWAQYENHLVSDEDREHVMHVRQDWSRQLSKLVKTFEN